jgi:hypothetical protein
MFCVLPRFFATLFGERTCLINYREDLKYNLNNNFLKAEQWLKSRKKKSNPINLPQKAAQPPTPPRDILVAGLQSTPMARPTMETTPME